MSSRPRVCLIVDTIGVDAGTERLVTETAKRLNPAKVEVHVVCLQDSPRLQALGRDYQTRVFPAPRLNSWNGLRQIREFRRYLKEARIDVMHAFMTKSAILGVAARPGSGCKSIIASRLSIDWYTPMLTAFFRYYMNPRTTRIWANSEGVKRFVVAHEGVRPEKVDVIYQGVDMTRFSTSAGDPAAAAALGIPESARVVGIVANYRSIKDLPLFLRAARTVAAQIPDAAFLLVGKGDRYNELTAVATELGIDGRVFFSNGKGNVADYLRRMSIACLSSESEGFSNAILEYMAMGLPVVATDVGGNGEAILHGETGFLVKERTAEAFGAPIVELLRNEELRRSMGARALERCTRLFSMETYIGRLEEYYRELAQ
jgi:glycosyltransferase involved in cell wall biosynthesis